MKACCLIFTLLKKHSIKLPVQSTKRIVGWLIKCLEATNNSVICDVLKCFKVVIKCLGDKNGLPLEKLVSEQGLLILFLRGDLGTKGDAKHDDCNSEEISLYAVICLEALLEPSGAESDIEGIKSEYLILIGEAVIQFMYSANYDKYGETGFCTAITAALNICKCVVEEEKDFAEEHVGELIGVAKAFMMRGIPNIPEFKPSVLKVSQQSLVEPQDILSKKGGKTIKKRKPRSGKAKNKQPTNREAEILEFSKTQPIYTVDRIKVDPTPALRTSGSDFSESESNRLQDDRFKQTKLRLSCLSLIERLAKTVDRKTMFGYWHCLFAIDEKNNVISLPNVVLLDSSPRCRSACLQTISLIVRYSKFYLYQAESRAGSSSSFTSFSVALGDMVATTYKMLTKVLSTEMHISVTIQLLKCFSSLIQATPFHRLDRGLVTNFVKYVRLLIYHKDWDVRVSSFMVIGFLLSVTDVTQEIQECIGMPAQNNVDRPDLNRDEIIFGTDDYEEEVEDDEYEVRQEVESENFVENVEKPLEADFVKAIEKSGQRVHFVKDEVEQKVNELDSSNIVQGGLKEIVLQPSSSQNTSWVLKAVLEILGIQISPLKSGPIINVPSPLKLECLHILSAMTNHFPLLRHNLHWIAQAITVSLKDAYEKCHLFAIRAIDYMGHAMNQNLTLTPHTSPHFVSDLNEGIAFWADVLPDLSEHIQKPNLVIRSLGCDAISNVGAHIYEKLPQNKQMFIISLLHGCCYDEDSLVRSSACRTLAVFALYPSLKEDLCFIENTSEMVVSLFGDPNVLTRIKCTWSLGNILEALVEIHNDASNEKLNRVSDEYIEKFFRACILVAQDQEKMRYNIMRCLGNLVRLLTPNHLTQSKWQVLAMNGVKEVVDNALNYKAVKVKWNACYSMGTMMRNEGIFNLQNPHSFQWQSLIFTALCELVVKNSNFKVRTAAAVALAVPEKRSYYETNFGSVWKALILGMEQAANLQDFNEYKHRDKLLDQLCMSISHLILVSEQKDLGQMKADLLPYLDVTKQNWFRVVNRILPEQAGPLLEAVAKVKTLNDAEILQTCFTKPVEY